MACLRTYSDNFFHSPFRLMFLASCLMFLLPSRTTASTAQTYDSLGAGDIDLEFPMFNDSTFVCSSVPLIVGYSPCKYNLIGGSVDFLPPKYNYLFPNQSGRMMYKNSLEFNTENQQLNINFSTFLIFQISVVPNQSAQLGAGIALIIAPTKDTPDGSEGGGLGLYLNDTATSGIIPQVVAVEFDTSYSPGIDEKGVGIPHIGFDDGSLSSVPVKVLGQDFLNVPVGLWVDYNDNASTVQVFSTPVGGATDASAAKSKPQTPLFTVENFDLMETTANFQRMYIGISGGIGDDGWEYNTIFYWRFTITGFPPPNSFSAWYVWYKLSTSHKIALIVGALFGTIGGAYGCSELCFFLFCKRIKKPKASDDELIFPYHWRTSLPGTRTPKPPPPRNTARDSLSVTTPLYLWEAPAEPEWKRDHGRGSPKSPKADISNIDEVVVITDIPSALVYGGHKKDSDQVDKANYSVGEAVKRPGARPSEPSRKLKLKHSPEKNPMPAGTKTGVERENKAATVILQKKAVQALEKKHQPGKKATELSPRFEKSGEKRAASPVEKKPISKGAEKKPAEPGTQTKLEGEKKITRVVAFNKPAQAGIVGPGLIKSPRLAAPPASPSGSPRLRPQAAEKRPSPLRKAISPAGKTPSEGALEAARKLSPSDRRVTFQEPKILPAEKRLVMPGEKKALVQAEHVQPGPLKLKQVIGSESRSVRPSSPLKPRTSMPAETKTFSPRQPSSAPKHLQDSTSLLKKALSPRQPSPLKQRPLKLTETKESASRSGQPPQPRSPPKEHLMPVPEKKTLKSPRQPGNSPSKQELVLKPKETTELSESRSGQPSSPPKNHLMPAEKKTLSPRHPGNSPPKHELAMKPKETKESQSRAGQPSSPPKEKTLSPRQPNSPLKESSLPAEKKTFSPGQPSSSPRQKRRRRHPRRGRRREPPT